MTFRVLDKNGNVVQLNNRLRTRLDRLERVRADSFAEALNSYRTGERSEMKPYTVEEEPK